MSGRNFGTDRLLQGLFSGKFHVLFRGIYTERVARRKITPQALVDEMARREERRLLRSSLVLHI